VSSNFIQNCDRRSDDRHTHRHMLQVIYMLSRAVYCIGQTKIRTKISAQINIKNTDYSSTHETSGVPDISIRLRLY